MIKTIDDSFAQYCLQTLTPLINIPLMPRDKELMKSQVSPCKCSKSGCLKLYCECFSKGRYCLGCDCINCFNVPEYEGQRKRAITYFQQKNSKNVEEDKQAKGCTCKKSGCKKNYCKCHLSGNLCGIYCKCEGCLNYKVVEEN